MAVAIFERGLRFLEAGFLSSPEPELLPMLVEPPERQYRAIVGVRIFGRRQAIPVTSAKSWTSWSIFDISEKDDGVKKGPGFVGPCTYIDME